jgi:hypothetical protein
MVWRRRKVEDEDWKSFRAVESWERFVEGAG